MWSLSGSEKLRDSEDIAVICERESDEVGNVEEGRNPGAAGEWESMSEEGLREDTPPLCFPPGE